LDKLSAERLNRKVRESHVYLKGSEIAQVFVSDRFNRAERISSLCFNRILLEKRMKTVLYRPNDSFICEENGACAPAHYRILSYSLTTLAATLLDAGIEVVVLDAGAEKLHISESIRRIDEAKPEVLLVTLNASAVGIALKGIEELKERLKIPVIAFITHPLEEEVLRSYPFVDIVVQRGWRPASIDIMLAISKGQSFEDVPGISFLQNGEVIRTQSRPFEPLDRSPLPPLHLFPMKAYNAYAFLFSVGCNFRCMYCFFRYPGKWMGREVDRCIEELKRLKSYGNRLILAMDEEFTMRIDYAKQIATSIISERLNLMLSTNIRADRNDDELFELLSHAGFFLLSFGVESGNQEVLNKNATRKNLDLVLKTSDLLKKYRIATKYFFRLLHDTRETIHQTFEFATEKLKVADASFDICIPYPGTPMYKYLKRRRWIEGLTTENLAWIYYNLYGCEQLHDSPMKKPFWRIGDLTFDDLVELERKYYHLIPHGGYRAKLGRWIFNPNFLRCAVSMAMTNPKVFLELSKRFL
jgi:radical SAM superfamily enzyme YgiQ (UPF0313 family)